MRSKVPYSPLFEIIFCFFFCEKHKLNGESASIRKPQILPHFIETSFSLIYTLKQNTKLQANRKTTFCANKTARNIKVMSQVLHCIYNTHSIAMFTGSYAKFFNFVFFFVLFFNFVIHLNSWWLVMMVCIYIYLYNRYTELWMRGYRTLLAISTYIFQVKTIQLNIKV